MRNTSKAGVGLIAIGVYGLIWFGTKLGITITETDAVIFVQHVVGIGGLFMTYWGQIDRKDLKMGLLRK